MFDPNFDPLEDLERMAQNQEIMSKNIMEMARAINIQSERILELHNRIQLLEMARQHEQKDTN